MNHEQDLWVRTYLLAIGRGNDPHYSAGAADEAVAEFRKRYK